MWTKYRSREVQCIFRIMQIYNALTFPFFVSSSSIAISYGHYRPAQPVRPLCEHSGVKVEREREFDRQKERERLEKQDAVGLRQHLHLQHRHLSKTHPVSAYAHWIWNLWTHCAKFNHTGENSHCHTVHTRPTHWHISHTQSASLFTIFCTYLNSFLWNM